MYEWIDTKNAEEGVKRVMHTLELAGITAWLDYGTLLGAIREKNFIVHDFDVDLGMKVDDIEKLVLLHSKRIDLRKQNLLMSLQKIDKIKNFYKMAIFLYEKVKIDLYVWYKKNNKYRRIKGIKDNIYEYAEVDEKYYDNLSKIFFLDKEYRIPNYVYVEEYLEVLYGKDWRIPKIGSQGDTFTSKKGKEFI